MSGKRLIATIATLTVTVGAAFAAGTDLQEIRKLSVEAELIAPPDVQYRDRNAFSPKSPSSSKWLMLKIEYTPDVSKNFVPDYRMRKGGPSIVFPGWMDNVRLDVRVLFETGILYHNLPVMGLMTGSTVFASVKRDGATHLALMFVPARMLDRYCVPGFGTRGVRKGAFRVEAVMSVGGREIRAFCNVSGNGAEEKQAAFEKMAKNIPEALTFKDAVLPRSRSPWALLAPDNFDLEKDEAGVRR